MKQAYSTPLFILIALSTGLLGVSMSLMGHHKNIELITDFYGISSWLAGNIYNSIALLALVSAAILAIVSIKVEKARAVLGWLLIAISLVPLVALFDENMWLAQLGGFPAIGSGQGVIKYFALMGLGLFLAKPTGAASLKLWANVFPVFLVLVWIGGMKFTLFEAQGIEVLVKTSPLMSWMYDVWDLQTTSNLIGVYDLLAAALLVACVFYRQLLLPVIVLSGAVFVVTQTFLFSWDAAISAETLLSTGGHFLIKDLWFIANLIVFWHLFNNSMHSTDQAPS
ncbi:hypothetical protein theurythT_08920 [Thalassotalea eurytherma]|uniref:DUF417 family protein n=2 Tax=Thalassotalea eurytherma TaxID=1144278 RepID=A0ABQ6H2T5_9GAMM|nr:hypothetical protein theurythT_08920 [Thalassotalea eurytherma]